MRPSCHSSLLLLATASLLVAAALFASPNAQASPPGQASSPGPASRAYPASSPGPAEPEYVPGELLVRFTPLGHQAGTAALQEMGGALIRRMRVLPIELWSVPVGRERAIIAALQELPGVQYAELNVIFHAASAGTIPNDPYYLAGLQWAHQRTSAEAAWGIATGSPEITIAILDTGLDLTHPEFAGRILPGYDFRSDDSDPTDSNGHGTHVTGIAAAAGNNAIGVAGVNWGASILPVRVLGTKGDGDTDAILHGIEWACGSLAEKRADILNMSFENDVYMQSIQDAVNLAHANGCLLVAAMGNGHTSTPAYPAAFDNVLAVSATTIDDIFAYNYSNYGPHVDVAAPGGEMLFLHDTRGIFSTMPLYDVYMTTEYGYYKYYDFISGTSMAAPYVAGLAALVWQLMPGATPDQVQAVIQSTADDRGAAGFDNYYGWGRVNAYAALLATLEPAPVLNPIANPELDGAYTVDWEDVAGATRYELQVSADAAFTAPQDVPVGLVSQAAITGQAMGLWHYRVRCETPAGLSAWSAVQPVQVNALLYLPQINLNYLVDLR